MVFGLGKPSEINEYEATGETERVYHEIKQTMRVTGVNLNFRTWASYEKFFPAMWDAMRPNVETLSFEAAADEVRAEAVRAAESLNPLHDVALTRLGKSQAYQIQGALNLYHYINPKLLVFTAAVRMSLDGEAIGGGNRSADPTRIQPGIPANMMPMETVEADVEDKQIQALFDDIKRTLSLSSINSDYRTLALWSDYLQVVWAHLKPITERDEYRQASDHVRDTARARAHTLPFSVALSSDQVNQLGEDASAIQKTTEEFERLLPSLILNIALIELVWLPGDVLVKSPFPATPITTSAHQQGGIR